MDYYLRYGVVALLGVALLLSGIGLWLWQGVYWQQGYLAMSPLPERPAKVEDNDLRWHVSAMDLQRELLHVFTAVGSALQVQVGTDSMRLDVLLQPQELTSLQTLPLWSGWHLAVMELQPKRGLWGLKLQWMRANASGAMDSIDVAFSQAGFDADLWQLSEQLATVDTGTVAVKSDLGATVPTWQLLGYWRQGANQGVWLLDIDNIVYTVAQGEVWQDFELLAIGDDGVTWRGTDGGSFYQLLCTSITACDVSL